MVPKGWKRGVFEEGIELISGQHVEAAYVNTNGNGIPYLTGPADFKNGRIIVSKFTSEGKKFSQKGDILITVKGSGTGKVLESDNSYAISRQLMAVRPKKFDSGFTFYNLLASIARYEGAAAGLIPGISRDDVLHTPILIPPIAEQRGIAQVLLTWDKAISATEQLLSNSQQQRKALMQLLFAGKKRLLDKNGVRFSGTWKEIRLKSVLREEKTRNKSNTIDRVLSVTNHSGFVLPENQFSKRVASDNVSNYKVVRKGQYGYNPSRLNVGSFARLDTYDEGLLSPMYVVFSVNEKLINSDYFMSWMGSNEAKQRILGSTQGSVRDSVGFDALCGFPLKLPPIDEQQKIAAVLSTADKGIAALQQKLYILKSEKKALMQQLLTGKRRVQV